MHACIYIACVDFFVWRPFPSALRTEAPSSNLSTERNSIQFYEKETRRVCDATTVPVVMSSILHNYYISIADCSHELRPEASWRRQDGGVLETELWGQDAKRTLQWTKKWYWIEVCTCACDTWLLAWTRQTSAYFMCVYNWLLQGTTYPTVYNVAET